MKRIPHAGGRPTVLPPLWAALAAAYGGVAQLAALLKVSPMSIWRWGRGSHAPLIVTAKAIAKLARKKKIPSPLPKEPPTP